MISGIWVLPTLHRPTNLERLITSYREVDEHAPILLLLWRDDPDLTKYLALDIPKEWDTVIEKDRFTAADAMRFTVKAYPDADFYGFLGDDIVFETKFSKALGEAAAPCFIAYPDDGLQHERLCTHFVVGGDLVRELGYWTLPGIVHSGIDVVWMILGVNVRGSLKYLPEVRFFHIHHLANRAEKDKVNDFAAQHLSQDNEVFQAWQRGPQAVEDVKTVRRVINEAYE
jgi:hypothetical protein